MTIETTTITNNANEVSMFEKLVYGYSFADYFTGLDTTTSG